MFFSAATSLLIFFAHFCIDWGHVCFLFFCFLFFSSLKTTSRHVEKFYGPGSVCRKEVIKKIPAQSIPTPGHLIY